MENQTKIEKIRKRLGLTQEEMARELKITTSHYRNIEKGRNDPSVIIALKMKKVLNCEIEDIFSIEEENKKED